ncbi:peptidyl-prolyl cis-trans isomerase FKBP42-like isoform X3 [Phoenix dactylifera]|uniref:Peptidyl-prolyl cis-trans isomerase FKBP42-like isoform X3 n=1 Tax=Phoenix dactylifera TaxID=42345 RepID=A0A8B8ZCC9_PHODC|nr:peptidyl-prolyl cis-trans isomerase FKBP42-like isoform X3 [Phoenix dactylifera]
MLRISTINPMVQMMIIQMMIMKSSLRVPQLCVMNLSEMTKVPQKLTLRWRSFTKKSRSKLLRRVMVKSQQNLRHAFYTIGHGSKTLHTNLKIRGRNSDQLNLSWEKGKARSDMTVEERIQAADGRKMEGNSYFKEEKLQEAMQQYEMVVNYKSPGFVHICFLLLFSVLQEVIMNVSFFCQAIAYMGDDFMFQLFGKYRDMALAVKNPCHLNMAACLIKLNQYEEAIGQCSIVLSEDENNVKALYRRGKARAQLGQTDAAREDFQKARKFAPEDKAIVRELQLLAEHDKAVYQKQKEIYKGIFGPRPEPKPKRLSRVVVFWQWLVSLICSLFKRRRPKTD